jgi:hypothetical protein
VYPDEPGVPISGDTWAVDGDSGSDRDVEWARYGDAGLLPPMLDDKDPSGPTSAWLSL